MSLKMSIKEIIKIPNTFLKVVAKPVVDINQNVLALLNDMLETMYDANGIGLAATQISTDKRLIVMDCGEVNFETEGLSEEEYNKKIKENGIKPFPIKMINPRIVNLSDDLNEREEGCLSIPGYNANVKRPSSLKVEYTDENKKNITLEADGLLATCIQHEIDHLNGILFIDHISKLKREIILKKAIKEYSTN
jgi:peptide deformylase